MRPVSGAGVEENAESFFIVGAEWRAGIEWVGVWVGSEWGWTVSALGGGLSPALSDSRGHTPCAVL